MKKIHKSLIALLLLPTAASAQSTDAAYPIGHWWNEPPGTSEKGLYVDVEITRGVENPTSGHNWNECGSLYVGDIATDTDIFDATLYYDGKGLQGEMGNGVYYFKAVPKTGKPTRLGMRRVVTNYGKDNAEWTLKIESVSGPMEGHAFLRKKLYAAPGAMGHYADNTPQAINERELMEILIDADPDAAIYGFGNRREFISAHKSLDPSKPKYAKTKGAGAVNIRERCNTSAAKIGELQPGQTVVVVDEYNGWCQVRTADKKYGWVKLNVVTLTNTAAAPVTAAAAPAVASASAAKSFVLTTNGTLGPLRKGQTVASLPKSVPGLYDSYKYTRQNVENDMEGSWVEEWCHFYKNGREIFKAFADGKKLTTFVLMKGSEFIKTSEGYHVGYNARELYRKKPMQWETYYDGTSFGTSGRFTYHIKSDDVVGNDFPTRITQIKQNAQLEMIIWQ